MALIVYVVESEVVTGAQVITELPTSLTSYERDPQRVPKFAKLPSVKTYVFVYSLATVISGVPVKVGATSDSPVVQACCLILTLKV